MLDCDSAIAEGLEIYDLHGLSGKRRSSSGAVLLRRSNVIFDKLTFQNTELESMLKDTD